MPIELPKAYEPGKYEDDISKLWEKSGFYSPEECIKSGTTSSKAPYFSIVLPPPNVTGTLHMGHAAMLAIEDIMVRYHRMKGDRTLWIPGTDHAAVATETKVESKLIKEEGFKKPKEELGREKFLERVRQFAQESHDTIVTQCRKMGASLDWSREAFTLDEARNKAVRTVFKKMYDDSLIYRGYRVVNWSVKGQSTCSDDELVYVERPAKLYYFKYDKNFPITIATTRPETKLGDTAVAVHPDDKRYKKYLGKELKAEFCGQEITVKIIADEGIDMNFGTGALGVTPAHSAVDFAMYEKQKKAKAPIELKQVIGEDGNMTSGAGKFAGLSAVKAREDIVVELRRQNLLEKEEDIVQNVGTSDRFGDIVEPLLKVQWFIDVNKKFKLKKSNLKGIKSGQWVTLKKLMQQVVKSGEIKIVPDRFVKTYFHWIDNLRDWNISRQIWYGHQVPVWYKEKEVLVGVDAPNGSGWTQDPDTLDTWFSSGLWTFSTLGWPDNTTDMKNFHPTSVLETGYDILFFWVARMILMTTYTLGTIPFETIYLHGLVRDEAGRKMSKSLGNIINPLDMIAQFGTDATRLSLVLGTTPGNDLKLSTEKIAGFRNFANKLWNISRFMLLNIETPNVDIRKAKPKTQADKWIWSHLQEYIEEVTRNIEKHNYSYAGESLRDFTWGDLADLYLEFAKIEGGKSEMLNYILNTILKLWHPFMPFVTETIWREVYGQDSMLMIERWPEAQVISEEIGLEEVKFNVIIDVIKGMRSMRGEYKIDSTIKLRDVHTSAGRHEILLNNNKEIISRFARLEDYEIKREIERPKNAVGFTVSGTNTFMVMNIDVAKEKVRLETDIQNTEKYLRGLESKLSNSDFVSRAPAAVVEGEKKKMHDAKEKIEKLKDQLKTLA